VGFGSVIEYAIMFLGRTLTLDAQLRLGAESSRAWTSAWHCGPERSLSCYFNLSACCAALTVGGGRPLELPRRRDPINVAARGFNQYGSAWVSAQMVAYLWQRMTPHTHRAVEARRSATMSAALPAPAVSVGRGSQRILTIGMHIRRGDSCHKFRYCPANLTSSYFAAAARLRHVYGPSRLLLATDDAEAARLCLSKAMGFECTTQSIGRGKFESNQLIEDRVAEHASGELSGSSVALDALADIDMLADADMFVLLFRSCFARVAYALAMSRKGRPPPVISLEAPWSPYKGSKTKMKGRKGLYGKHMGWGRKGKGTGPSSFGTRGDANHNRHFNLNHHFRQPHRFQHDRHKVKGELMERRH